MNVTHFLYPLISWWTFRLLLLFFLLFFSTIMNNAAVNTYVHIFLWAYVFISFGCISRSGNAKAFVFFRSFLQMVSSLGPILRVVWWTAWTTHSPSGWVSLLFRIHIAILNSPLGCGVFCLFVWGFFDWISPGTGCPGCWSIFIT